MNASYKVTYSKIEACIAALADSIRLEGRRGDPRPMLLEQAARIVANKRLAAEGSEDPFLDAE